MIHEVKSFEAIQTKVLNENAGLVEAVFSVTNLLDRGNDIIHPGAFAKAMASSRLPTVVFAHVDNDINQVLGKTVSWSELLPGDPDLPPKLRNANLGGVKANLQFDLETPSGRLGFTHVKNNNLNEWSFAYTIAEGGFEMEYPKSGEGYTQPIRHLKDINEVLDITLCVIGMNQATSTLAWKTANRSPESLPGYVIVGAVNAFVASAKAEAAEAARRGHVGPGSWLSSLSGPRGRWVGSEDD